MKYAVFSQMFGTKASRQFIDLTQVQLKLVCIMKPLMLPITDILYSLIKFEENIVSQFHFHIIPNRPNQTHKNLTKYLNIISQNVIILWNFTCISPKISTKNRTCACLFSLILTNVDQMNLSFMLMMFLPGNCMPRVTFIML